jgi:hypothetical protein
VAFFYFGAGRPRHPPTQVLLYCIAVHCDPHGLGFMSAA